MGTRKDGCPRRRGLASSTCLVGTGSQGRTRGNQRSLLAHRARTLENQKPLTTAENKPVRNPRLQPLDQEPSRRCKRMRTRERRREERSSSEWSFLPSRSPVFYIDCI